MRTEMGADIQARAPGDPSYPGKTLADALDSAVGTSSRAKLAEGDPVLAPPRGPGQGFAQGAARVRRGLCEASVGVGTELSARRSQAHDQ